MIIIKRLPRPVVRNPRPVVRVPYNIVRKAYPCKPRIRKECSNINRPCVFVSCRYNLCLDVMRKRIKYYFDDPLLMEESCALDIADKYDGMKLEQIASFLGLSRERIRQIIDNALRKIMFSKVK